MAQQHDGRRALAPTDTGVMNQLVNLYLQQNRQNEALEILQSLSTLEPTNYQHPLRIAQIYAQLAQVELPASLPSSLLQLASADERLTVQQFVDTLNP